MIQTKHTMTFQQGAPTALYSRVIVECSCGLVDEIHETQPERWPAKAVAMCVVGHKLDVLLARHAIEFEVTENPQPEALR
jgi:hypothetical protein